MDQKFLPASSRFGVAGDAGAGDGGIELKSTRPSAVIPTTMTGNGGVKHGGEQIRGGRFAEEGL